MPTHRRTAWLLAGVVLVGALAIRVAWLAAAFYLGGAPRFPLESAAIALVVVGLVLVLARGGDRFEGGNPGGTVGPEPIAFTWLLALVAASFVLFAPALRLGFLSDDYVLRAVARAGSLVSTPGPFFRPVPLIIWRASLAVSDSAIVLHTVNVLLHGVNAFLVALAGVRLGLRREVALIAAALFLTFPAAPEAVAWCSGIQDVLLTTCALGAVVAAGDRRATGTVIAGMLIVIALGSKETAVCIPALIAVCWFDRDSWRRREQWLPFAALLGIVIVYVLVRFSLGIDQRYVVAPSRYFLKQLIVTAFGTLAAPWRLPASAAGRWLAVASATALTALLTHAFVMWRRTDGSFQRALRMSLWVIAAVAPVFTLFFVSPSLEGSRYVYLAECGWALLVAELLWTASRRVPRRSAALMVAATLTIAVSVVMLERELAMWSRGADLRDRVLLQARESIANGRCITAHFADVPDSIDGVYVFRNGFAEAMSDMGTTIAATAAPGCDFAWSGDRFVPSAR